MDVLEYRYGRPSIDITYCRRRAMAPWGACGRLRPACTHGGAFQRPGSATCTACTHGAAFQCPGSAIYAQHFLAHQRLADVVARSARHGSAEADAAALGRYGQTIVVIPHLQLIIVTTAAIDGHEAIFGLIEQMIVPAVQTS